MRETKRFALVLRLYPILHSPVDNMLLQGMTPLHFAADRGYNAVVQCLLERSAQIDAVDTAGHTPLMYAVSCENTVSY